MKNSCTIQIQPNFSSEQSLNNRQNISRFVIGGEEDYVLARILHQVSLHDSGMYHYQQCLEKFMKSFLIERDIHFKPTHDLELLRARCVKHDQFFREINLVDACSKVTPFEVWGRYPAKKAHSYGWVIPDLIYFLDEFVYEMRNKINRSGFYDIISEMRSSGKINPLPGIVPSSYLVDLFFLNNQYFTKW